MKNGFKRVSRRVLSTLLCLLILLSTMSVGFVMTADADSNYFPSGEILYLNATTTSWKDSNARTLAYFYNSSSSGTGKYVEMTDNNSDGYLQAVIPSGSYDCITICRKDPNNFSEDKNTYWNCIDGHKYNGGNCVTPKSDLNDGTWSTKTVNVYIAGSFNDWANLTLNETTTNIYENTVSLSSGTHTFKVKLNYGGSSIWYGNEGTINGETGTGNSAWDFWADNENNCTLKTSGTNIYRFSYNMATNKLAVTIDDKPTATINTYGVSTASATVSDTTGLAKYYWGTSSTYSDNPVTTISGASATLSNLPVEETGKYYLTVEDSAGQTTTVSTDEFYKLTLNANGGDTVSPSEVYLTSSTGYKLPTATRGDFQFLGWDTNPKALTGSLSAGTSYKIETDKVNDGKELTLYAIFKPEYYLRGDSFGGWNNDTETEAKDNDNGLKMDTADGTTYTKTVYLPAGEHQFKIAGEFDVNSEGNANWITVKNRKVTDNNPIDDVITDATVTTDDLQAGDSNAVINATGGFYTFTFNYVAGTLTITKAESQDLTFYYAVPNPIINSNNDELNFNRVAVEAQFANANEKYKIEEIEKLNETYNNASVYKVVIPYGEYSEVISDLVFNMIDSVSGSYYLRARKDAVSNDISVADINGKMFVYNTDEWVAYSTDILLPEPKFVINSGVTSVSTRESITFDFTESLSGVSDLPTGTTVTLTVSQGTTIVKTITLPSNSYKITLDKKSLDEGEYTVKAEITTTAGTNYVPDEYVIENFVVSDAGLAPYYLIGNGKGENGVAIGDSTSSRNYPFEVSEIDPNGEVFEILSIPYSAVGGSGVQFRLTDGFTFFGPTTDSFIQKPATVFNNDVAFTSANAVTEGSGKYYTNSSAITKVMTVTWDYVNVYFDTRDGKNQIYITQVDQYYTTSDDTKATLTANPANVSYNASTELTATFTGSFVSTTEDNDSDGVKDTYTGSLIYQFYQMTNGVIDPTKDTLLGRVRKAQATGEDEKNTASITVDKITDYSKFYVLVSPATNTTVRVTSPVQVVSISHTFDKADVKVYVDFGSYKPTSDVKLARIDINSSAVEIDSMTYETGSTAIYSATYSGDNGWEYTYDRNGKVTSIFTVQKIIVDGKEVYLTASQQPDINEVLQTGEIWFKFTKSDLNFNQDTKTVDNKTKYELNTGYFSETDVPNISVTNVASTTRRIYCTDSDNTVTNNNEIFGIYFYNDGAWSKWYAMHEAGKNNVKGGEMVYYYDIPITSTKIKFGLGYGKESNEVTIEKDSDYNTHNAYYIDFGNNNSALLWPNEDTPATPMIQTYVDTVDLSLVNGVGNSYNITPVDYYDKVKFEITEGNDVITLDTTSGLVTAKAVGTAKVKITPMAEILDVDDYSKNIGAFVTVTINVVDKTELSILLFNAMQIISDQSSPYKYESSSFKEVMDAYGKALEVYRNSFDANKIEEVSEKLKIEMCNEEAGVKYLEYAEESSKAVDLISYKSAKVTLVAENASNSVITDITSNGIIKGNEVTYAAYDGTSSNVGFNLSANTAGISDTTENPFIGWSQDSTDLGENLNVNNYQLTGDTTYIAMYPPQVAKNVIIKYIYKDYDVNKSKNYEYLVGEQYLTDDLDYTTNPVSMDESWLTNDELDPKAKALIKRYTPTIISSYFNYSLDEVVDADVETDTTGVNDYIITVELDRSVRMYSVMINGNNKFTMDDTDEHKKGLFHFQEMIDIDASNYVSGEEVYWYNAETPNAPISLNKVYHLRVTENMSLGVKPRDEDTALADSSVVTPAFAELDGNNKFHQNFFIQHFFDPDADNDGENEKIFVGAGVMYYTYNKNTQKPSNSKVQSVKREDLIAWAEQFAKNSENPETDETVRNSDDYSGYTVSFTSYDKNIHNSDGSIKNSNDPTKLFRYSTSNGAFNYFYDKYMSYKSSYSKYAYHLYSYYVYKEKIDGSDEYKYTVVLSNDYASADCYLSPSDIANQ